MSAVNSCDILCFRDAIVPLDNIGCLKPDAHNDAHINLLADGSFIQWEDDCECKCGCWDEGDFCNVCKVYSYISKEQAEAILSKYYNGNIPENIIKLIENHD